MVISKNCVSSVAVIHDITYISLYGWNMRKTYEIVYFHLFYLLAAGTLAPSPYPSLIFDDFIYSTGGPPGSVNTTVGYPDLIHCNVKAAFSCSILSRVWHFVCSWGWWRCLVGTEPPVVSWFAAWLRPTPSAWFHLVRNVGNIKYVI